MCEAFPGRLPTEIWAEVQRLPVGFLDEVVEARGYVNAKRIYDSAGSQDELPKDSPMIDLVRKITFEQAREAMVARRG